MAAKEREGGRHQGVVPVDLSGVFEVISRAPKERLESITLKFGNCDQAEQLVQALSLLALGRDADALQRLQVFEDHPIATYLSTQVRGGQGKLSDLTADTFHPPEPRIRTVRELARIFRVLAREGLCEASLCDEAYQAVLLEFKNTTTPSTTDSNSRSSSTDSSREICPNCTYFIDLLEEVKQACGADVSVQALQLKSNSRCAHDTDQCLGEGSSLTLSCPTSLLSGPSSYSSYPSHLEISAAPTQCADTHTEDTNTQDAQPPSRRKFIDSTIDFRRAPSSADPAEGSGAGCSASAGRGTGTLSMSRPGGEQKAGSRPTQCSSREGTHQLVTSVSEGVQSLHIEPPPQAFSRSVSAPEMPANLSEELEAAEFYSFVILNAPDDADMAEELRMKLESATAGKGATFSQEFAVAGQSTFGCLENAIDNSAFTVLLLTCNFSTRMQEVFTNSALINSINKEHKYNSVIPLLPLQNAMPSSSMPIVLRTIIPLQERNRNFAQHARRAMSPEKVDKQWKIWLQVQQSKRRPLQGQGMNERPSPNREGWEAFSRQQSMPTSATAYPHFSAAPGMGPGPPPTPPPNYYSWLPNMDQAAAFYMHPPMGNPMYRPSSIHISNAQCIMIGNDSTMTIGDPSVLQDDLED